MSPAAHLLPTVQARHTVWDRLYQVCRDTPSEEEVTQLVNPLDVPWVPLRPLPLIEVPFDSIGMDIIGPLERSAQGYRFVLVLIDNATRYPETIPLRNISVKSVEQALFHVILRVGIPKEILTDQITKIHVTHA